MQKVIEAASAVAAEQPWRESFAHFSPNWYFPTPDETERRLTRNGFVEARCWLHTFLLTPEEPVAYLETIPLGSWLQLLPSEQRHAFAERVADRLEQPLTIANVPLDIDARRASLSS
jgi:trans-aconitate 2-methyltransferase